MLVTNPNVLLSVLNPGLAKFAWLKMLYAFAPIWNPRRSVTRKFLRKLKSLLKYPGPRNALRAIVPKLEAVANCEGEKHG